MSALLAVVSLLLERLGEQVLARGTVSQATVAQI